MPSANKNVIKSMVGCARSSLSRDLTQVEDVNGEVDYAENGCHTRRLELTLDVRYDAIDQRYIDLLLKAFNNVTCRIGRRR